MKIINNNQFTAVTPGQTANPPARILATLVLSGILSLGASMTLVDAVAASPGELSHSDAAELVKDRRDRESKQLGSSTRRLPTRVANAVRRDLSSKTGISREKLRITSYSPKTWGNGCLDLPKSGESCTEALVPGWHIVLSDSKQTWFYRTDTSGRILRRENQTASVNLPQSLKAAVLQDASRRSGLPISALRIVQAQQRTWPDGCLGLYEPGVGCTLALVEGWQVAVEGLDSNKQRWVYRTNKSGPTVRLDRAASSIGEVPNSDLPSSVAAAVLQDVSERSRLPVSALRIIQAQRRTWPNGCLGLSEPGIACTQALVEGWEVAVEGLESGRQRWVYRTNESGSIVKLDRAASTIGNLPNSDLPSSVAAEVLQDVSGRSRLPVSALRIIQAQRQDWPDGCLGLGGPNVRCTGDVVPGWRVTVEGEQQTWVYRTNESGSTVKLDEAASSIGEVPNSDLPSSVEATVLQDVSRLSGLRISALRIDNVQRRTWPDACLGRRDPLILCAQGIVPGWRVTVASGEQRWVYHTNASGSSIWLNAEASQIGDAGTLKPNDIPESELPPSLDRDVIFRAIASGGITGRTYQTTLLNNGQVIRVQVNHNGNTSEPQIHQVSPQQLQTFQKLLEGQQLSQFNKLNYPAPRGAADYITVTLTSRSGTIRYADLGQGRLPKPLQEVIKAWNQIVRRT